MNIGRQASVSIVLLEMDNGSTAYQVQALSDGPEPSKADELAAQLVKGDAPRLCPSPGRVGRPARPARRRAGQPQPQLTPPPPGRSLP